MNPTTPPEPASTTPPKWREHPDTVHLPPNHPNVLETATLSKLLDWGAIFPAAASAAGAARKSVMELGCATGTYLLQRAVQDPPANLIGVEFANKYFIKAAERARKRNLTQVRVIRTEASAFVHNFIGPASLDEMHIYHPDPWPKERHLKRRLIQPLFVDLLARILKPDGFVVFQSDHEEYFRWAEERLSRRFNLTLHPEPWPDAPAGRTNWEIKFLRLGLPIWRMIARNKAK